METCKLCGAEVVSVALHNFNCVKVKEVLPDEDWESTDKIVDSMNKSIVKVLDDTEKKRNEKNPKR